MFLLTRSGAATGHLSLNLVCALWGYLRVRSDTAVHAAMVLVRCWLGLLGMVLDSDQVRLYLVCSVLMVSLVVDLPEPFIAISDSVHGALFTLEIVKRNPITVRFALICSLLQWVESAVTGQDLYLEAGVVKLLPWGLPLTKSRVYCSLRGCYACLCPVVEWAHLDLSYINLGYL